MVTSISAIKDIIPNLESIKYKIDNALPFSQEEIPFLLSLFKVKNIYYPFKDKKVIKFQIIEVEY